MNKSILGVVIVVIFIIGAGGVYWYFNPLRPKPQTPTEKTTNTSRNDESEAINVKCTTEKIPGSFMTMYINDFKGQRTDTEQNIGGKVILGHILYDGQYMYIWAEEDGKVKTGMKSYSDYLNTMSKQLDAMPKTQGRQERYIAMNKAADIDCEPWVVDESIFALPQGVEFTEQAIPSQSPTNP